MHIKDEIKKTGVTVKHQGYFYNLSNIIEILIMGLMCRMQKMNDIYYWATSKRVSLMLREKFDITEIPSYSHFTILAGMLDSAELNKTFMEFFSKLVGAVTGKRIAIDNKVTEAANPHHSESPLYISSTFVVENGITIAQLAADSKSDRIPAARKLIRLLDVDGAAIVADALYCREEILKEILNAGADYVLSVKKNQLKLYELIEAMIKLEKETVEEKGYEGIDKRRAFVSHETQRQKELYKYEGIQTVGAILTDNERRYYISSRQLSGTELLKLTSQEWAVESMHLQLDFIFDEDKTTQYKENAQKTLNILSKAVLNVLRAYRDNYEPSLNVMDITRKCLHDLDLLLDVLEKFVDFYTKEQ